MQRQITGRDVVSQSKRKRSRRACEPCRKRKKKCDGLEPCQLCLDFEYDCHYTNTRAGRQPVPPRDNSSIAGSPPVTIQNVGSEVSVNKHTPSDLQDLASRDPESVLTFPDTLAHSLAAQEQSQQRRSIYHLGLREGALTLQGPGLRQLINIEDFLTYSRVYFVVVHIWYDYLEGNDFEAHAIEYWQNGNRYEPSFEMLAAFVVALGSYFSWPSRFDKEEQLVKHAVSWMNADTLPDASTHVNMFLMAAYIERTLYYRATASPRMAWMSSCSAIHMAESMGLHKEWSASSRSAAQERPSERDLDCRRRMFWLARNINTMISAEYGRGRVQISVVECLPVDRQPDNYAQILLEHGSMLPQDHYTSNDLLVQDCNNFLSKLSSARGNQAYIKLVRGDMACLAYRRLISVGFKITSSSRSQFLKLGREALNAAVELANAHTPWWKVGQTPFQILCALLSMDEPESLALVPEVLQTISHVHGVFGTERTKDAQDNSLLLVQYALRKKEQGVESLKNSLHATSLTTYAAGFSRFENMDLFWADLMDGESWNIEF